ncbi:unnamed protein product (mitochondrion) [Plasmodiophora brassicae]|uniref:Uncharacterized protein n=2 Tax=Plasmodiophora brassicae TaxID=37360 RepID=A0A3P3Y9Y6_PLABS|nr:unnamed protein product [Plasmodiophora brassicae]
MASFWSATVLAAGGGGDVPWPQAVSWVTAGLYGMSLAALLVHVSAWAAYFAASRSMTIAWWFAIHAAAVCLVVIGVGPVALPIVACVLLVGSIVSTATYSKASRFAWTHDEPIRVGPAAYPLEMSNAQKRLLGASIAVCVLSLLLAYAVPVALLLAVGTRR